MKVFSFHLMPYADLDTAKAAPYRASWVNLPNELFDPQKGARLYHRYLDELIYADELGMDGVCVNEHHQTAYGMMPSPIVMASILARQTKRCRIGIIGSGLPLRDHPLTLAEEHSMIDCISGGRLITGFVRGIGAEYHAFGVNPTFSHERFQEAHDLLIQAWTKPGPTAFIGKHYRFNYVNMWPRPIQKPHPPIWIPSQGSTETIDWASHPDRRYTYLQTFSAAEVVGNFLQQYRDTAERYGYAADDDALGWSVPIYVAETDEQAVREFKPHYESFRDHFLKMPPEMLLPPGYTSRQSLKRIALAKKEARDNRSFDAASASGLVIAGSAKTVFERLAGYWDRFHYGNLLGMFQLGTLPADLTRRNLELFAREVMPKLQALTRSKVAP